MWAIPPVRLGLSGRNSGEIPERPRKRSQSVSWNSRREYSWDAPNPIIQGIWGFESISRIISPPIRLGALLFSEVVPERANSWIAYTMHPVKKSPIERKDFEKNGTIAPKHSSWSAPDHAIQCVIAIVNPDSKTFDQQHFYANKAKQRCATFVWNATKRDTRRQNEIEGKRPPPPRFQPC